MGKTTARASIGSSASTSYCRLQRYSSGSFAPRCVWTSSSSAPGTSSRIRSSQGSNPALETTTNEAIERPGSGSRGQEEVVGLLARLDEADRAGHGHEQALRVHVARVDLGRLDLARQELLHLLAVLLQVVPVHHRRPARGLEILLRVADELGERGVQLAEAAVEFDGGHRVPRVVEAGALLAGGARVALAPEQRAMQVRRRRLVRAAAVRRRGGFLSGVAAVGRPGGS